MDGALRERITPVLFCYHAFRATALKNLAKSLKSTNKGKSVNLSSTPSLFALFTLPNTSLVQIASSRLSIDSPLIEFPVFLLDETVAAAHDGKASVAISCRVKCHSRAIVTSTNYIKSSHSNTPMLSMSRPSKQKCNVSISCEERGMSLLLCDRIYCSMRASNSRRRVRDCARKAVRLRPSWKALCLSVLALAMA